VNTTLSGIGRVAAQAYLWLVVLFLFFPALVLVAFSFNKSPFFTLPFTGVTAHWFGVAFRNAAMITALEHSLEIAALTAMLATVGGFLVALGMRGASPRLRRAIDLLGPLPLLVPAMIWSIALLILMTKVRVQPSVRTVLAGHVLFTLPFVVLLMTTRLTSFQREWEEASLSLGASRWVFVRRIFLPHMMPAVIAGALMAFTLSFNDFVIAFFLTGAGFTTLPIYIFSLVRWQADPSISAVSSLVFGFALILVVVIAKIQGREVASATQTAMLNRGLGRAPSGTGGDVVEG
jgi:spermidine/putrescine transport system permease protein